MSDSTKLYRCENRNCVLGSRKDPGFFTGGMSAEARNVLTGDPVDAMKKGKDYGDGICPNCGEKATAAGTHKSAEGKDPHRAEHAHIEALVADPASGVTTDTAYDEFLGLVGEPVGEEA